MPGSGDAVGGGVMEKDDGSGTFVPGEADGLASVQVLWGVDVAWFTGGKHAHTAWAVSGGGTALGSHAPQWGATCLQGGLTDLRGTAELSR